MLVVLTMDGAMTMQKPMSGEMIQRKVITDVIVERARQDIIHPYSNEFMAVDRLSILIEEVGEVGKAMYEREAAGIRRELIHVAAVAIRWLEAIDREGTDQQ